jgi:ATP-dependent helicase/nuclease subunit A
MEQGNSDTVRVITVHGSKGLEAPIVIMPDTISMPDGKNSRILWYETQDSADIMLWPGNSYNAEKICQSIKQRRAKEDAEEYNRLLYVAITRAKSELYIAGTAGKNSKKSGCWYDSISEAMARLTTEDADGAFRLVGGNSKTPGKDNPEDAHVKTLFPEYLLSPPRPEPTPSSPISPSKIEDGVSSGKNSLLGRKRIIEGKIIHSLLEFMPDIAHPERREAGKNFLKRKFISMPEIDIDNIIGHLISIMDMSGLKDVFGEHSRAEVPIIGIVENKVISGRIDRLCVLEDKVIIVDYKTGQSPPDIASISGDYIRQMSLYSSIMQRIYQDKSIEAYLIWTEGAIVFDISNKILEYKYKYTSSV